jgi:hypothetical protein
MPINGLYVALYAPAQTVQNCHQCRDRVFNVGRVTLYRALNS